MTAFDRLEGQFSSQSLQPDSSAADDGAALSRRSAQARDANRRLAALTKRQREILELIAVGCLNKQIAARLDISTRTVEAHRMLIMKKIKASSLADLVRLTLLAGGSEPI